MKQFRIFIALLVCILMTSACGGGGGSDDPQSPQNGYNQSITLSAYGGIQEVTLNGLNSAISSIGSTPSWLVLSPLLYSSGTPSIKIEFQENTGKDERKCNVTILAVSGDKVTLSITQQASGQQGDTDIDGIHNNTTSQPAYAPSL